MEFFLVLTAGFSPLLAIPVCAWLLRPRRPVRTRTLVLPWGAAGGALVLLGMIGAGAYFGYHYGLPASMTAGFVIGWSGAERGAMMWGICFGMPGAAVGMLVGGTCGWLVRFRGGGGPTNRSHGPPI
jgi:hypothetical protein